LIIVGSHNIANDRVADPEVNEREVMDFCSDNNIFFVKINGENNKGMKEPFEYGPATYMLKKENNIESLIFRQMQRNAEY
jgi:hypothetical protein